MNSQKRGYLEDIPETSASLLAGTDTDTDVGKEVAEREPPVVMRMGIQGMDLDLARRGHGKSTRDCRDEIEEVLPRPWAKTTSESCAGAVDENVDLVVVGVLVLSLLSLVLRRVVGCRARVMNSHALGQEMLWPIPVVLRPPAGRSAHRMARSSRNLICETFLLFLGAQLTQQQRQE